MADLVIGTFEGLSSLRTGNETLLLTTISRQTAQAPEGAPLAAARERSGEMAVVRGERDGDVLFEATIVEIVSDLVGRTLQQLIDRGQLDHATLQSGIRATLNTFTGGPADPVPESPDDALLTCALVVGHTRPAPGAVNQDGETEFGFNDALAKEIKRRVRKARVEIVHRDEPNDLNGLPAKINALQPDFILSLHCNAFNTQAGGTETLHWHTSTKGRRFAEITREHLLEALNLRKRKILAIDGGRGGHLLRFTNAPCVIAEPFFIDNSRELGRARERRDQLIDAYAAAIDEFADELSA